MADITIKAHDTYPPLQSQLSDSNGPVDLTNASSVKIILKGSGAPITGTCTIVAPVAGQVRYFWAPGDLAVVDTYAVEFEITWAAGRTQTVPNASVNTIQVVADLEGG